jgi:hypothetical protein
MDIGEGTDWRDVKVDRQGRKIRLKLNKWETNIKEYTGNWSACWIDKYN